jgi:hypothetical protein
MALYYRIQLVLSLITVTTTTTCVYKVTFTLDMTSMFQDVPDARCSMLCIEQVDGFLEVLHG